MPRKASPICGNPLYLQWIKEMMEEAGGVSNNKMYYAYKKVSFTKLAIIESQTHLRKYSLYY